MRACHPSVLLVGLALASHHPAIGHAAAPPAAFRLDCHGDPLPPGALARLGTVRFRQTSNPIWTSVLTFSRDGKVLAVGGPYTLQTWGIPDGKPLRQVSMPWAYRGVPVFSPGGEILIWRSDENGAVSCEPGRGKVVRRLPRELPFLSALSPDGTMAARAHDGNTGATLWNVRTGKKLGDVSAGKAVAEGFAFSCDGKLFAACLRGKP